MDIRFYTDESETSRFEAVSFPIRNFTSFIWEERYYGSGGIEIQLPPRYMGAVQAAQYIYNVDTDRMGIVTSVELSSDADGVMTLGVKGEQLKSLLASRIIEREAQYNGNVETTIYDIVTQYALTGARAIPLLELSPPRGYPQTITAGTIKAGTPLSEAINTILKTLEMAYDIIYDWNGGKLKFSVYKGLDRTTEQTENNAAIFSTSFRNIKNLNYLKSTRDYKNTALVQCDNGIHTLDNSAGSPRREVYVTAPGETLINTPQAEQLAAETLEKWKTIENISAETIPNESMRYGVNYNLGDLCEITANFKDYNAVWRQRITAVTTSYEYGDVKIIPEFGEPPLDFRQYLTREMN